MTPITKNIIRLLLVFGSSVNVLGTMYSSLSSPAGSERHEYTIAGKSHADEKSIAAHALQQYAKDRKTVTISSVLSVSYHVHCDITDCFVVRQFVSEGFFFLEFAPSLSDLAPPLPIAMESFSLPVP